MRSIPAVTLAALALVATACGSASTGGTTTAPGQGGFTPPKIEALKSLGAGEGQVNLVAWAGYAEDGSNDKNVDWVHPFEQATGIAADRKTAATSDEITREAAALRSVTW